MSSLLLHGGYTLLLFVTNFAVLRALVEHALGDATASHILLIPFVTLALLCQDRGTIFFRNKPAWLAGAVVIVPGLALVATGRLAGGAHLVGDSLSLAAAGLVIAWIGGFLLFFGCDAARKALFPLLFLAFAIPMPAELIEWLTRSLKTGSAKTVASLLTLTGTPYHREGFVFALPGFLIEIADGCSGIRSSIALVLTSLLASRMFLRIAWARALLVAATLPIAILKNGVRIVSLCLLSIHVDPEYLTGQLHHEGGVVFFLPALAMLALVMAALMRYQTLNLGGARVAGADGTFRD